jgi:hypothetical protein
MNLGRRGALQKKLRKSWAPPQQQQKRGPQRPAPGTMQAALLDKFGTLLRHGGDSGDEDSSGASEWDEGEDSGGDEED